MNSLALVVRFLCLINRVIGSILSWLTLGIVLVCFTVVVLRYVFSMGFVWMQDLYVWMNGVMFMGIAGYTLLKEGHVRVDIFYRTASPKHRARVDIFGCLVFIAPFVYVIFSYLYPYVRRSWRFMESSPNFGGMDGFFIVKTFILVFAAVIAIQALAMLGRSILTLADRSDLVPEDYRYKEHH